MKRYFLVGLSMGWWATVGIGYASAQLPSARPAVSPYLNLLRGGQSPGLNYYDLVQPAFQVRNSLNQLQTQTTANQQGVSNLANAANQPLTTGHRSGFMNYSRYFLNNNAQGNLAGRAGATANRSGAAAPAAASPVNTPLR